MMLSQKPSTNPKSRTNLVRDKVVVIGGGTGTFVVLSGLKHHPVDLSAIITVADSGGSTGRLRDEFGFQPVGDLRQSLAALATANDQTWIKDLLLYRFANGKELKGHNLGNLILTALQDMAGSTPKALEIAGKIFRLEGHIYPSTLENVQLVTTYSDGIKIVGEHLLDDRRFGGQRITSISLKPPAKIYEPASQAIREADLIIIGPGDLYGSLLPNVIVSGFSEAISQTKAKIIYIINLMTRYTQTHNFTARDHVETLAAYLQRLPDYLIVNTGSIPRSVLNQYKQEHEFPVKDDLENTPGVIRGDFVAASTVSHQPGDFLTRSVLRHDQEKLTQAIMKLLP